MNIDNYVLVEISCISFFFKWRQWLSVLNLEFPPHYCFQIPLLLNAYIIFHYIKQSLKYIWAKIPLLIMLRHLSFCPSYVTFLDQISLFLISVIIYNKAINATLPKQLRAPQVQWCSGLNFVFLFRRPKFKSHCCFFFCHFLQQSSQYNLI